MPTISRLYDFQPNTLIESAKVDDELNQLVALLNGSGTTKYVQIVNNTGDPTLSVNNTGGGPALRAAIGGVTRMELNASGQLDLSVPGVAPMLITSSIMVNNLNAQFLGGVAYTGFLRSDTISLRVSNAGGALINFQSGVLTQKRYKVGAISGAPDPVFVVSWEDSANATDNTGTVLLEIDKQNDLTTIKTTKARLAQPTEDHASAIVRKDYADALEVPWSWGTFYAGVPVVGLHQPLFVVPDVMKKIAVWKVVAVVRDSAGTGITTFALRRRDSTGALYAGGAGTIATVTINSDLADYGRVTVDVNPDVSLVAGDILEWEVTAASADHQNITLNVQGVNQVD